MQQLTVIIVSIVYLYAGADPEIAGGAVVGRNDVLGSYFAFLSCFPCPCMLSIVPAPVDVLALDLEGVHDVKLHHPSSSVATSNQ